MPRSLSFFLTERVANQVTTVPGCGVGLRGVSDRCISGHRPRVHNPALMEDNTMRFKTALLFVLTLFLVYYFPTENTPEKTPFPKRVAF